MLRIVSLLCPRNLRSVSFTGCTFRSLAHCFSTVAVTVTLQANNPTERADLRNWGLLPSLLQSFAIKLQRAKSTKIVTA